MGGGSTKSKRVQAPFALHPSRSTLILLCNQFALHPFCSAPVALHALLCTSFYHQPARAARDCKRPAIARDTGIKASVSRRLFWPLPTSSSPPVVPWSWPHAAPCACGTRRAVEVPSWTLEPSDPGSKPAAALAAAATCNQMRCVKARLGTSAERHMLALPDPCPGIHALGSKACMGAAAGSQSSPGRECLWSKARLRQPRTCCPAHTPRLPSGVRYTSVQQRCQ